MSLVRCTGALSTCGHENEDQERERTEDENRWSAVGDRERDTVKERREREREREVEATREACHCVSNSTCRKRAPGLGRGRASEWARLGPSTLPESAYVFVCVPTRRTVYMYMCAVDTSWLSPRLNSTWFYIPYVLMYVCMYDVHTYTCLCVCTTWEQGKVYFLPFSSAINSGTNHRYVGIISACTRSNFHSTICSKRFFKLFQALSLKPDFYF